MEQQLKSPDTREIDKQKLAKLDGVSLDRACKNNEYLNSIYEDDDFWRVRTLTKIPDSQSYKNKDNLWVEHYFIFDELKISNDNLVKMCKLGNIEAVIYLLDYGIERNRLDLTKYLLSLPDLYRINVTAQNNKAIVQASDYGALETIKYLLNLPDSYGIDPSTRDNKAIKKAYMNSIKYIGGNFKNIVRVLIKNELVFSLLKISNDRVSKNILNDYG